jgi:site-specific DNA-methyltransferase (adenine-specific)
VTPYYSQDGITIYHADCWDVLPTLETGSIDLVLTDPPYSSLDVEVSVGTTTRLIGRDQLAGKRLASSNGRRWFSTIAPDDLAGIWPECQRVLSDSGALYVFADVKSGLDLFPALNPANVIVWDKGAIGMGYNWRRMHEWIAFCPMAGHKLRNAGQGDILRYSGVFEKIHPTQKPVGLLRAILLNSTDPGHAVLDPFMGSGSTLRAAKDLGRKATGIEIEERYCEIAARRLQQEVLSLEMESA